VLLKSDPHNFKGTASYTAAQVGQCLRAGNCFISTYNAARGTPFFQQDTRFSKTFTFHERMRLEFFFQAFNLTNRANFGGNYSNNIRSSAFGKPQGFIAASSVVIPQFFAGEAGFTLRF
jgi:hypothetical protein